MNIGRIIEVGKRELGRDRMRGVLDRAQRALQERTLAPRQDDEPQQPKTPLRIPQRRKA